MKRILDKIKINSGYEAGNFIAKGDFGKVYSVKGARNLVIKVARFDPGYYVIEDIEEVLSYFYNRDIKSVVKIYGYGWVTNSKDAYYFYVMDRLYSVPYSKFKKISNVYNNRDYKKIDNDNRAKSFIRSATRLKYTYDDLHSKNLMRDKFGNYKLIDLEGFIMDSY